MFKFMNLAGIVAAALIALACATPAQAQATRTWISGVGDDVNPCSRTAPCKTFAGAISKTATGGEIDCLDPAGFGGVTVTKSITLDCGGGNGGQVGSILVSGTNGITVNCTTETTCLVKVRNLTINGIQRSGSPGLSGIKFLAGGALIVEHVGIFGMGGSTGSYGGVDFEPTSSAKLSMVDVETQYGLGDGILIKPGSGGNATATLTRVSSLNNAGAGLRVDNSGTPATGSSITLFDSTVSGNASGVVAVVPASAPPILISTINSVVAGSSGAGMLASGNGARINLGGSTISANVTGLLAAGGGVIKSFGDNYFVGNAADGAPTAPNLTKQ